MVALWLLCKMAKLEGKDFFSEFRFKTSRSGGSGGQNVNKVSSKVILEWDPGASGQFSDEEKVKLAFRLRNRLTKEGLLQVVSQEDRSQHRNKELAIKKFMSIISEALKDPKKRVKTKIPRAVKKKRLENKRKLSEKKKLRKLLSVILVMFSGWLWAAGNTTHTAFGMPFKVPEATFSKAKTSSFYIPMRDGVMIAVDLVLPQPLKSGTKIPCLLVQTRYWREVGLKGMFSGKYGKTDDYSFCKEFFPKYGYAMVFVDVRGTGASFGDQSKGPLSKEEIEDGKDILDWIVKQDWSNGRVGALGVSYEGLTAELLASNMHPALKAIIPISSEFDVYTDIAMPGGAPNVGFIAPWADINHFLDNQLLQWIYSKEEQKVFYGVKRTDTDKDGAMVKKAMEDHKKNIALFAALTQVNCRDEEYKGLNIDRISPFYYKNQLQKSGVAIFAIASWMDAGVASGALSRFLTLSNEQQVLIGAWDHGCEADCDPCCKPEAPTEKWESFQYAMLNFFNKHLKPGSTGDHTWKGIAYYTMGEQKWKFTKEWPMRSNANVLFLGPENSLGKIIPPGEGKDEYTVNYATYVGYTNRWNQGVDVYYGIQRRNDSLSLLYNSQPLEKDMEVTGHPLLDCWISSTSPDFVLYCYLEAVAPDGSVSYITEGIMRAAHREISSTVPPYYVFGPHHSFMKKDMKDMPVGVPEHFVISFLPTSIVLKKDQRIRLSITLREGSMFPRIPSWGAFSVSVHRSMAHAGLLNLPVVVQK